MWDGELERVRMIYTGCLWMREDRKETSESWMRTDASIPKCCHLLKRQWRTRKEKGSVIRSVLENESGDPHQSIHCQF